MVMMLMDGDAGDDDDDDDDDESTRHHPSYMVTIAFLEVSESIPKGVMEDAY